MLIKGAQIEVEVSGVDVEGAGVAATEPPLHVPYALPGERVIAEVLHVSPHGTAAWGRLHALKTPSPERVAPACRAFGRCGGCVLQHWEGAAQLAWKRERLAQALGPLAGEVLPTVASPRALGYRNRSKLVWGVDDGDGRVVLGAYAPRSHDIVDLAGCAIAEPPLDEVAARLAELARALGVSIHDERRAEGVLRYALLRVNWRGEVQVLLVVAQRGRPEVAALGHALGAACPSVLGVVENFQPARGDALVGRDSEDVVLAGEPMLEERVGAVRLLVSPRAFLQVNRGVAERLYADVARAAALTGAEQVIDVYSGVGGIALTLAPGASSVIGIEEEPAAVRDAAAAAALGGVGQARFLAGDAARLLGEMARHHQRADVVVLNPPRKGVAAEVLAAVEALRPRTLLYVSCSPDSLARDLGRLAAQGYPCRRVTPYDMLPHTPHVEALAELTPGPA
ncbi:MAG TPA: 23S rRNA (uracil(1939)-C(5))-methyltransferase RlmD [Polyangia bacterium]|nr:23S rRNA (uracil(1939)-C(5))-methyltransferase RlmD [Polyangia bacterium]